MKFRLYSDGGSRGNPGDSAYAYIVCDQEGREVVAAPHGHDPAHAEPGVAVDHRAGHRR